jgi:hypothetical protein
MVKALGFSQGSFDPQNPGRLCRGRERWIQAWEADDVPVIHRLVVSGAEFSDDSARDARRGLNCAGITVGTLVERVFGTCSLIGFKEEGELSKVPEAVADEELFLAPRRGGAWFDACQRWRLKVEGAEQLDALVELDALDGLVVLGEGQTLTPELEEALYLLSGMGDGSAYPVKRFQPLALVEVLQHCEALICLHLDKHGPSVGMYTLEPMDHADALRALAEESDVLAVPFAIPPMLARWDRALQELRSWWMENREEEFPVPPASEPTRWSRLGRRRGRRGNRGEE